MSTRIRIVLSAVALVVGVTVFSLVRPSQEKQTERGEQLTDEERDALRHQFPNTPTIEN
jgi:hypothetical protein